jgi:alpha-beta hydrolase superfamily lysophospholipase
MRSIAPKQHSVSQLPRNRNPMNPATKRILKITALILVALPLLSALAGLVLAPTVLHPFRRRLTVRQTAQADQAFQGLNATREDFIVRADDGILLSGWKIRPAHPSGDWVFLLHGRSHNRSVMLPYAEFLLAAGYSVVMMDARAHGNSGGAISTYGQIEIFDTRVIVKDLEATEKVGHLFALGESMGAAVSLQSAAFVPQIEGVVAEGSFRNLREVTFDYAGLQQSAFLGKTLLRPAALVAVWIAQTQAGFRFEDISPEKAVAVRPLPVLLICGASDRKIPCRHSAAIFNSAIGPKALWNVPAAGHEQAIKIAPAEFQRRVLGFFRSITDLPGPVIG